MKHRYKALFGLIFGILSFGAVAQSPLKLVLAHGAAAGTPRSDAALWFAETLKEKSQGKIDVEVAGAAKRGDNLKLMTALRADELEMALISHGTLAMVVPEVAVLGLPYAFSSPDKAWELLDGEVGAELNTQAGKEGMIVLGWMDNGVRHFTSNKRPIRKSEDLKGMRVRSSSDKASLDMMTGFSALPVPIPYSKVKEAMQLGFVDAQDNTLANIYFSKLHQSAAYLSLTQHCYGFVPFVMGEKAWARLSADQRSLIKAVAAEATQRQRKISETLDGELLAKIQQSSAVQVVQPDRKELRGATEKVWDAWELKPFGAFVKRVRAAY